AIFGAVAVQEDLETRPVVQLQQLGDQMGRSVVAEVGRQIADAQPTLPARASLGQWPYVTAQAAIAQLAYAPLLLRRRGQCHQREWNDLRGRIVVAVVQHLQ